MHFVTTTLNFACLVYYRIQWENSWCSNNCGTHCTSFIPNYNFSIYILVLWFALLAFDLILLDYHKMPRIIQNTIYLFLLWSYARECSGNLFVYACITIIRYLIPVVNIECSPVHNSAIEDLIIGENITFSEMCQLPRYYLLSTVHFFKRIGCWLSGVLFKAACGWTNTV